MSQAIWIWWFPTIAVALHIAEEFAWPGGFAEWDRGYRPQFRTSITPRLHVIANALLVALCLSVVLAGMERTGAADMHVRSVIPPAYAVHGWIFLAALLFSNAIFHLVGTLQARRYSPGVVTGMLLYVPLALFGTWHFVTQGDVSLGGALVAAVLGGSYHLWARFLHALRARTAEAR